MKFQELYKSLLIEQFDPEDYNTTPAKTKISLMVGRWQPFHRGHSSLTNSAKYPVIIGTVKGQKTSLDKKRNPLDFDLQKEIILKAKNKKIRDVVELPSGFIPEAISRLRDLGYETKELLAGQDRSKEYKSQMKRYGKILKMDLGIKVLERLETDPGIKGISATKVRQAILDDDFESAKTMMINLDKGLYNKIRKVILKAMK